MIETDDVTELFHFFTHSLGLDGYRLESANTETRSLFKPGPDEPKVDGKTLLILDFSLSEFAATLEKLGSGAEFMWPGTTTKPAGLRLLLTHLYEMRQTRDLGVGNQRLALPDREPVLSAE